LIALPAALLPPLAPLHIVQSTLEWLARRLTYWSIKPTARKITKIYRQGITLKKKVMKNIERCLERTAGLETWFIEIVPNASNGMITFFRDPKRPESTMPGSGLPGAPSTPLYKFLETLSPLDALLLQSDTPSISEFNPRRL
jgi:hypothetical protein